MRCVAALKAISCFVVFILLRRPRISHLTHGTGILVDQGSDNEDKIRYLVLLDIQ
jgi:hypothetical protein